MLAMLGGKDVDRLPSASTCYNMLKLPNYRCANSEQLGNGSRQQAEPAAASSIGCSWCSMAHARCRVAAERVPASSKAFCACRSATAQAVSSCWLAAEALRGCGVWQHNSRPALWRPLLGPRAWGHSAELRHALVNCWLRVSVRRRASTLKTKLLYAISSGAGFELS